MDSRTPGPHHHLKHLQKGTSSPDLCGVGLCLPTAGDATISFVQPVSVSASLGKAIQISCTLSGGTMATYTISWFQHQLPNPPKYLLYYKDGSSQRRIAGVSDRFAASKNASLNACYLTISEVQAADEATYYCLSSTGSEYHCATCSGVMKTKPYPLGNSFTTAGKRRPAA